MPSGVRVGTHTSRRTRLVAQRVERLRCLREVAGWALALMLQALCVSLRPGAGSILSVVALDAG